MGAFGNMLVRHSLEFGGQPARQSRQAPRKCKPKPGLDELENIRRAHETKRKQAYVLFATEVSMIRQLLVDADVIKDGATIRDIMDIGSHL